MRLFHCRWCLSAVLGLGLIWPAAAQTPVAEGRYLVYLRDKAGSPFSVGRPEAFLSPQSLRRRARQSIPVRARDLPVNPAYLARVRAAAGAAGQVHYASRWLNAVLLSGDAAALNRVRALPEVVSAEQLSVRPATANQAGRGAAGTQAAPDFARHSEPAPRAAFSPIRFSQQGGQMAPAGSSSSREVYGKTFAQNELLGVGVMHEAGFRGEGIRIAVFDAGFPGVGSGNSFAALRTAGRLAGTRNFVDGGRQVDLRDSHGTNCLSTMAAELPGFFVGTAPRATYYLCLTEDAISERPVEEANWLAAAEYADSAGVDIISSSLGYTAFQAPFRSYTYADLNGRTALSTRAAVEAARVGMLVVTSAGNEGNSAWRYISAPADADSIISVAAVDSLGRKASFSSFGPTADGRLAPTLAAQGVATAILTASGTARRSNGTSFACPSLAGLAAGFWQANPQLSAQQVIGFLTRSASQALAPDNELGSGIPNFAAAQALAGVPVERPEIYPNPGDGSGTWRLRLPPAYRGLPARVRVFDARGRLVRELALPATPGPERPLPLGTLAGGLYLCQVSDVAGQPARAVRFAQP